MIILKDRILLNNGMSIVSIESLSEMILSGVPIPDYIKVEPGFDAEKYKQTYIIDYSKEIKDIDIEPKILINGDDTELLSYLVDNKRDTSVNDMSHYKRVEKEIEFFYNVGKMPLLHVLQKLIKQFKEKNIVWSGRGSSCASYVLFLLEVHDINPIRFNIDFSEFSKEY